MLFFIPISHSVLFADYFTVLKNGLFFFSSFLACLALAGEKRIFIIRWRSFEFLVIAGLIVMRLVSVGINRDIISVRFLTESFGFLILSLWFLNMISQNLKSLTKQACLPFLLGLFVVCVNVLNQIYGCRFIEMNVSNECFSSYFGNINMLEEYLILTLPMTIFYLRHSTNQYFHFLIGILLSTSIFIIWQGQSRSTLIGLCLLLLIFLYLKVIQKRDYVYLFLSAVLVLSALFIMPISKQTFEDKAASTSNRAALLAGSFEYFKNMPWGDGPGSFEYGYIPFQKYTSDKPDPGQVFLQPHNEFLRLGIESGWLFIALFFLFLSIFTLRVLKKNSLDNKFLYLGFVVVVLPQLLFQFPLENGFSLYWLSFCSGLFMSVSEKQSWDVSGSAAKLFFSISSLVLICLTVSYLLSNHLEFYEHDNIKKSRLACRLDPANSRACGNLIENEINSKNLDQALILVTDELRKRPFNFVALRYLMIIQFETDQRESGCQSALVYNEIFENRSDLKDFVAHNCPNQRSPLASYDSGITFRKSYLSWLSSLQILE